jgi:hypothetical protein
MPPQAATRGFSPEAEFVAKATRNGYRRLQRSNAVGIAPVREELGTVWEECRNPDWDGFGALAVSQDSLRNTYLVLESLPLGFPLPSIGAEPDGQFTLEWHRSPSQTFSVSVDPDGLLHYAGLFGPNRRFGTEVLYDELPEVIQRSIRELYE